MGEMAVKGVALRTQLSRHRVWYQKLVHKKKRPTLHR